MDMEKFWLICKREKLRLVGGGRPRENVALELEMRRDPTYIPIYLGTTFLPISLYTTQFETWKL